MKTNNGTPYTDEQWIDWYNHKSNKEMWIEEQERVVDQEIEDCNCSCHEGNRIVLRRCKHCYEGKNS